MDQYTAVEKHTLAALAEKEAERLAGREGLHAHRLQKLAKRLRADAMAQADGRAA